MFFHDPSPYTYALGKPCGGVRNIGWLCRDREFESGATDPLLLELLKANYSEFRVNRMRGTHECDLCWKTDEPPSHLCDGIRLPGTGIGQSFTNAIGQTVVLGGNELWVPGLASCIYAAPDMVIHYIEEHQYMPPIEFVDAVLRFRPGAWSAQRAFTEATEVPGE